MSFAQNWMAFHSLALKFILQESRNKYVGDSFSREQINDSYALPYELVSC